MKSGQNNRYSSIPKRNFHNAVVHLLEEQYKLVGSHKVISMIADDIMNLHREFYPDIEQRTYGHIAWRTTAMMHKKPSYGTKVEDYEVKTVFLPLITEEDVVSRIESWYNPKGDENYKKQTERDIEVMARIVKSAYEQGGLLSGAELSVLLNRSLGTIGRYMTKYHETHKDILPTKGMVLDQGSRPTHKGSIIHLYEQGYPEIDIARITNHRIESVGRYIKNYKNIKLLLEKRFNLMEIVRITGMGRSTVIQYRDLIGLYHEDLRPNDKDEQATAAGNPRKKIKRSRVDTKNK